MNPQHILQALAILYCNDRHDYLRISKQVLIDAYKERDKYEVVVIGEEYVTMYRKSET